MESRQIIRAFSKERIQVRPDAAAFLLSKLEFVNSQCPKLEQVVQQVYKLLSASSLSIADKTVVEEALFLLETGDRSSQTPASDIGFSFSIVLGDYFKAPKRSFDYSAGHLSVSSEPGSGELVPPGATFFANKLKFLRWILDDSRSPTRHITEIGSMRGCESNFTIFGILFSKKGEIYIQDHFNEAKINLEKCLPTIGYACLGSIVLATGSFIHNIFHVEQLEMIQSYIDPEGDKLAPFREHYKAQFAKFLDRKDESKEVKEFLGPNIFQIASTTNPAILVLSNFLFKHENLEDLKKIFYLSYLSPPSAIVLLGPFSELMNLSSQKKIDAFQNKVDSFSGLVSKFLMVHQETKIILVPAPDDTGFNSFPRPKHPSFYFANLLEKYPYNFVLAENPLTFTFCDKLITFSRMNWTFSVVRNVLAPFDQNISHAHHSMTTLFGQRDLILFKPNDFEVFEAQREACLLYNIPDIMVDCDDSLEANVISPGPHAPLFCTPGNFSSRKTYLVINPKTKSAEIKSLN